MDTNELRAVVEKMTAGLKRDPYGTSGRYTQDADGCVVIRTENPDDQAALIYFQNNALTLADELDRLRAEITEQCVLNGKGAERELALLGERDRLRAELAAANDERVARLLEAISWLDNYDPESADALLNKAAELDAAELTETGNAE